MDTTYGWIECAGLADRSAFDLTNHSKASKIDLVAYEQYDAPRTVEVVEVTPQMKVLGKELKAAGKACSEHLQALTEDDALALKVGAGYPKLHAHYQLFQKAAVSCSHTNHGCAWMWLCACVFAMCSVMADVNLCSCLLLLHVAPDAGCYCRHSWQKVAQQKWHSMASRTLYAATWSP